MAESIPDRLTKEYSQAFEAFDDLTLARWLSQTLGQLKGRAWRFSHPLVGTYRLAAEVGHHRQIWLKRLANIPAGFSPSPCCRAPFLPLLTRDIVQSGLICQHCTETLVSFEDLPDELKKLVQPWADMYADVHAVAHWTDQQIKRSPDYDQDCDEAAGKAEVLLGQAACMLSPRFLEHYPVILWEDQDECLEVLPEDIILS